jgi:hypothetical protein
MNVATLPGIIGSSIALMDAHRGYGFCIGGVAAFGTSNGSNKFSNALVSAIGNSTSYAQFVLQNGNSGVGSSTDVVATADNGSDNDIVPRYPSSYSSPNIIAVASYGSDNSTIANFSNYGKNSVDLAAKGVGVYSTLPGNNYGYIAKGSK